MGLKRAIFGATAMAAAVAAVPAFGASDGSCPPTVGNDPVYELATDVRNLGPFQNFAETSWVQRNQDTTFDLRQANDSHGQKGIIATEPFSPQEIREMQDLEKKLPDCLRAKANIVRAFRAKRGVAAEKLGILGIAYAYNNGNFNKEPDGSVMRGGQIVVTDLFFNRAAFNKRGTGDEQMQVGMGWSTCQPAGNLTPEQLADVATRARNLPPQLKKLSRERILFHEYIHGVTHEQENSGYTDPNSVEGFFRQGGASRYDALRARLYQAGGQLEQFNAKLRSVRSREEYCAIFQARADYLKAEGVPQRWPGDTHALDDKDEYVTILLEQMMYDRAGMTGYTDAEKQWAENWWNYSFNPAYKQNGAYAKVPFGKCAPGTPVVSSPATGSTRPAANAFGGRDYFGGW